VIDVGIFVVDNVVPWVPANQISPSAGNSQLGW